MLDYIAASQLIINCINGVKCKRLHVCNSIAYDFKKGKSLYVYHLPPLFIHRPNALFASIIAATMLAVPVTEAKRCIEDASGYSLLVVMLDVSPQPTSKINLPQPGPKLPRPLSRNTAAMSTLEWWP